MILGDFIVDAEKSDIIYENRENKNIKYFDKLANECNNSNSYCNLIWNVHI